MIEGLPTTPLEPEGKLTERLEAMMDRETVLRPWRLAQLVRAGVSFSDALAGHRVLGREDRTILGTVAIIAISSAVVVGFFPLVFGWAFSFGVCLARHRDGVSGGVAPFPCSGCEHT